MINNTHKDNLFSISADLLVCLFLGLITLAVYWQVTNNEFVNYDDMLFVTNNPHVQAGLTRESITFILTNPEDASRRLTMLSHMLDFELFGLNAGLHHLTSLILHIANAMLLFIALNRMTGARWRSSFVAALFALHPFNVESVAWVAERRNVLSTFFWILTMLTYVRYAKRPGLGRYLVVLLCFGLGLTSKSMLVTLPFVLLLLDYWPLKRFQFGQSGGWRLILEKVPLLALSAASCLITLHVVISKGTIGSLSSYPLTVRIANALVSYIAYIAKTVWPFDLTFLYPYPNRIPLWQVAGACLLIGSVFLLIIRSVRRRPYLFVGWLWYIGTLVPVIGLVQIGLQAMADRYAYVPLIGLFIMIAWGVPELVAQLRYKKTWLSLIAATLVSILATATLLQVRYWKNSITLFEHALHVTTNNYVIHYGLGLMLASQGETHDGINHFYEALRINPDFAEPHKELGIALANQGKMPEAAGHFSEALRIDPGYTEAHNGLGFALSMQGRMDEASKHYLEALKINPQSSEAHNGLGVVLAKQGRIDEAIKHFSEALKIDPGHEKAQKNLNRALTLQRK